jgi:hypothetical protein
MRRPYPPEAVSFSGHSLAIIAAFFINKLHKLLGFFRRTRVDVLPEPTDGESFAAIYVGTNPGLSRRPRFEFLQVASFFVKSTTLVRKHPNECQYFPAFRSAASMVASGSSSDSGVTNSG